MPVLRARPADQERSGFGYAYSIYQVEYSRNLLFASGPAMERAFDTIVDRTRVRLDVPSLRTLFGVGQRPRYPGVDRSPRQAVVIRAHGGTSLVQGPFRAVDLKGYTKGEHVCNFEAIVHNTRALHTGRMLEKFPVITTRLAAMVDRFTTMSTRRCRLPSRRHPRPAPNRIPGRGNPSRRHRHQQAPEPGSAGRRARPGCLARRITVADLAAKVRSLTGREKRDTRPPGRRRSAETAGQTTRRQTQANPSLPRARTGCPHHRRPPRRG